MAPVLVFAILMGIYVWTMVPGNFWVDSAAFAACNAILGLPHSPSFPLYTILGRVMTIILPVDAAVASNLYSALTSAAAGVVLYFILLLLFEPVERLQTIRRVTAASGALFACLTIPVWQSSVRAEVYSLQILLTLVTIFLFIKTTRAADGRRVAFALATIFIQGLSFTNHSLMALITFPLVLALPFFIPRRQWQGNVLKYIFAGMFAFGLALSVYTYLPVRANQDPAINSGQPKTVKAAFQAISRTGEDYYPPSVTPKVNYLERAGKQARFLFDQTTGLVLLTLFGSLLIAYRERNLPAILLWLLIPIGFAITVWAIDFLMVNFDIVAYTAPTMVLITILAFYCLYRLIVQFQNRDIIRKSAPLILTLLVVSQFSINLFAGDLSGVHGPDRLARSILSRAPANAIIILDDDNAILPLWYHCFVNGERADVALVLSGALYRPTYRGELRHLYPTLKYPPGFSQYKINDIKAAIHQFCELNASDRPILVEFGTSGIEANQLIPDGFLFRYAPSRGAADLKPTEPTTATLDSLVNGTSDLLSKDFVGRMAFNLGVYFQRTQRSDKALDFFQYAINTDVNPDYLLNLGVAALNAGHRDEAMALLREALKTGDGSAQAEKILGMLSEPPLPKQ